MPRLKGLPELSLSMSCSSTLYDLMNGTRLWNQYGRLAMRAELEKHHALRIPKHFRLGAAGLYGYARRKGSTKLVKVKVYRLPADLDLVKTKTMSLTVMRTKRIGFAGNLGSGSAGGTLQGQLTMNLGHPLRKGRKPDAITPEQIKKEITAMTPAEKMEFAEGYRNRLVYQIRQHHGPMRQFRKTPGKFGLITNPAHF